MVAQTSSHHKTLACRARRPLSFSDTKTTAPGPGIRHIPPVRFRDIGDRRFNLDRHAVPLRHLRSGVGFTPESNSAVGIALFPITDIGTCHHPSGRHFCLEPAASVREGHS